MRTAPRSVSRAAASSMVVAAALGLVGVQAAAQTATAATKEASSIVTCTTANTRLTVTEAARPINHLLLKATNTAPSPATRTARPICGPAPTPRP